MVICSARMIHNAQVEADITPCTLFILTMDYVSSIIYIFTDFIILLSNPVCKTYSSEHGQT